MERVKTITSKQEHIFNKYAFIMLSIHLVSCGGGSSSSGDPGQQDGTENRSDNWSPSGTIVFEQGYDYGYHKSLGIVSYNLDTDQLTLYTMGLSPERHVANGKTAFLQECADIPSEGLFYRVVVGDSNDVFTPITPCSTDVSNPTTGVFILEDITEYEEVSLSQDETRIAVTINYDVLSDDESRHVGEVWNTQIFDLSGNLITELENAYNATWLSDGRLLFVFDNHLYLTDINQTNPVMIDNGGFASPVYHPAVHPDEEYFVFEYNNQIWRMNLDGSNPEKLIAADKPVRYPEWSPNGEQFVFTTWRSGTPPSALKSLFFVDVVNDRSTRVDIDHRLDVSGEPWGRLSWTE